MKHKSFYTIIAALIAFAGNAWADTDKLPAADGWTKITTVPTEAEIGSNYYVFVDATRDLMLGVAKGVHQNTKWYSLGLYYLTSVEPTSANINGKTWILETQSDGFALRNLEYSALCFQTESAGAWMFDTNDVSTPNQWAKVNLIYANGIWTIQNGKNGGSNYIGPWDGGSFKDGAECAANKSATSEVGHFQIYAINRAKFKQNLLDNASESNPVDLTPFFVTNATFDLGNRTGWTESGSDGNNNTSYGGGCEIWHRSDFNIYQDLNLLNGRYKVSLQMAGTTGAGKVYGTSNGTTKEAASNAAAGADFQNTILSMIQDRTYGQTITDEITVSNGKLTIGMKCETTDQWINFDNFKLYCTGLDLSAYQTQLADLVTDCNDFISSDVVPTACENAISSAITTYNKSYKTAKEYSAAILALTAVLETYQNNTELQTAYSDYKTMRTNVTALANTANYKYTDPGSAKTTFDGAISAANTAVEAATTASAINTQTANIRTSALTFISSVEAEEGNPFNIMFLASQLYSDWKKQDGSAAGIVGDAYLRNRPEDIPPFAENFEWTAATTGNVLYQTVSSLPVGYYQVGMYAMALSTSERDGMATDATEGDADRSFAFAGDQRTGLPIKFATSIDFTDLTTLDVNVHLASSGDLTFGVQKDANGSNWHFAQIITICYSKSPDLTGLKETRDAIVSEAEGLLASADAELLTSAQRTALQNVINEADDANTFDDLNTVTLTTLPNAINTAKSQIQTVKDNRLLMIAALERFETDYNLADGTDYCRSTMSAAAWTDLLDAVNAVSTALDDVSQAANYGTLKDNLVNQMNSTDTSLRLFKSYKAMVDGTTALSIVGSYGADSNMDTDATQETAIEGMNTAFVNYANSQEDAFSVAGFLGSNLDFSAAEGAALNTENSNNIHEVSGWEVEYANADTWAVLLTHQSENDSKLYMRKNWGSSATTLMVRKQKMLPEGIYRLSLSWNSNMSNMTNRSSFKVGNAEATTIGESGNKTITYDFEVTDAAQPFDLVLGFKRNGTGDAPAQLIVDDVALTYKATVALANAADNTATLTANNGQLCNVKLADRTLYKDGSWNTICLPFNMTAEQVTAQLAPTALMELDTENSYEGHTTGLEGSTLYLNFKDATAITASTPYLIKWESGDNLVNPKFNGVTITSGDPVEVKSSDDAVTFLGTYSPAALAKDDETNRYLASDNTLCWPNDDGFKVNAFRAYFKLSETAVNEARSFVLNLCDDITDINDVKPNVQPSMTNGQWSTINGVPLNGKPSKKGIYIFQGKKLEIK